MRRTITTAVIATFTVVGALGAPAAAGPTADRSDCVVSAPAASPWYFGGSECGNVNRSIGLTAFEELLVDP